MQTIKKFFRNTYTGEDVIASATYTSGSWLYEKEYIPKTSQNQGFGKTAVVIGNGVSRLGFNLAELKKSHLQTSLKTYGCNALYREFTPDFLVVTRPNIVNEVKTNYCNEHVVYASSATIVNNPGNFHLIPQDPSWNSGSLAAYLACFDGYSSVYLLGFDGIDTPGHNNNVYLGTNGYLSNLGGDKFMTESMLHVFKTYPEVDFVLVNGSGRGYMPEVWKSRTNVRRINFRELVLECDL
jgi:hypothetical protein